MKILKYQNPVSGIYYQQPSSTYVALKKPMVLFNNKSTPKYNFSNQNDRALYTMRRLINESRFTPDLAAALVGVYVDENGLNPKTVCGKEYRKKGAKGTRGANEYGAGPWSWTGVTKKELLKNMGLPEDTKFENLPFDRQVDGLIASTKTGPLVNYFNSLRNYSGDDASMLAIIMTGGVGYLKNWKNPTSQELRYATRRMLDAYIRTNGRNNYTLGSIDRRIGNRILMLNLLTPKHKGGSIIKYLTKYFKNTRSLGKSLNEAVKTAKIERPILQPKVITVEPKVVKTTYIKPWRSAWSNPSKTRYNTATSVELRDKPNQYFEMVQDAEPGNVSVHFKTTGRKGHSTITDAEKQLLFDELNQTIPEGSFVSTYGSVSPGGVHGLNRLAVENGYYKVGTRMVLDKLGNPLEIPIYLKSEDISPQLLDNLYLEVIKR